jgi:pimeloyl-ACP methyl ester carboxylesterase
VASLSIYLGWAWLSGPTTSTTAGAVWDTGCAQLSTPLGLDRFHLVVHDIGGPIGFELAAAGPTRILSLTLLNTVVAAETFHRPRLCGSPTGLAGCWAPTPTPRGFCSRGPSLLHGCQ